MKKNMVIVNEDAVVTGKQIQMLDKDGKYIVSVCVSSKKSPDEIQVILNKVELAFKAFGIKKVQAIAHPITIFKVKEENGDT